MPDPNQLSHFDPSGQASMVDVGAKQPTRRPPRQPQGQPA